MPIKAEKSGNIFDCDRYIDSMAISWVPNTNAAEAESIHFKNNNVWAGNDYDSKADGSQLKNYKNTPILWTIFRK